MYHTRNTAVDKYFIVDREIERNTYQEGQKPTEILSWDILSVYIGYMWQMYVCRCTQSGWKTCYPTVFVPTYLLIYWCVFLREKATIMKLCYCITIYNLSRKLVRTSWRQKCGLIALIQGYFCYILFQFWSK